MIESADGAEVTMMPVGWSESVWYDEQSVIVAPGPFSFTYTADVNNGDSDIRLLIYADGPATVVMSSLQITTPEG